MKTLLLVTLISGSAVSGVEVTSPEPQDLEEEILLIRDKMRDLENLLRDDRSGEPVEISGKEIVSDLDKLIKEIEDAKETDKEPKGKPLAERWRKLRALAGLGGGRGRPAPRKVDPGRLSEGDGYDCNRWAHLSKEQRDVIIQDYKEEIPVKWKSRIEAYFISIADEATPKK